MRRPIVGSDGRAAGRRVFPPPSAPAAIILCLLALALCASPVRQSRAAYPIEEVTLVMPVTEGSQPALLYSLIQRFALQYSPVPVKLKYLPGRGGSYAWSFLKGKPGNGYILAALHFPSVMLLAADRDRVFAPDDMAPVALFAYAANALWVAEDSPIRTLDDLVAQARDSENSLIIAGTGSYTDHQMVHLIFNRAAGVKTLYLPLTGTVESMNAVKEKRAAACWGYALARSSMPGLRPLAVAAPERCPALPDTPAFRERDMEVVNGQYFGLAAPVETKDEVRDTVAAFFLNMFSNQDLLDEAGAAGFAPALLSPRDMLVFVGKQQLAAETFLKNYPMLPKGALPLWSPRKDREESDAGDIPELPMMMPSLPEAGTATPPATP